MIAMGGGTDVPSHDLRNRNGPKEKQLVVCALPWPKDGAASGIQALKEAFDDVEVEYFQTNHDNAKPTGTTIPQGMEFGFLCTIKALDISSHCSPWPSTSCTISN